MDEFTYRTFGDTSSEVMTVVEKWIYFDSAVRATDVEITHNFKDEGYAIDGEDLDGGIARSVPGTLSEVRMYQYVLGSDRQFVTICVRGQWIPANGIPLWFSAVTGEESISWITRNVPRGAPVWTIVEIVFKRPGATTPIIKRYIQRIEEA